MARILYIPGFFEPELPPVDVPKVVFSLLICVFGLLGNLIAIFVILVLREYKKSVTHWYVLQLAIADSLFLLTLPFKVNEDINNGWIYPDWMCKAKETILFLNYYASILFLVIMSIDRYIAVCHTFSLTVQKLRTQTSAIIITITVWSISLLICIPVMLYSFKIGSAPYCECSYEFPKPVQNITADCLGERFTSEEELQSCLFITSIPDVDNGEPYCMQYDPSVLVNRLGSGSGVTESGDEGDDVTNSNGNVTTVQETSDYDLLMATFSNSTNFKENMDESSGGYSANRSNINQIHDACHYWDHPLGWKIFINFNFIVMLVFPFLIMLVCYGLIVQRLSASKMRSISTKSVGSQKKKPSSRSTKDRKRVTIMCAALVSCFLICWLPFHTIHLAKFIGINATEQLCVAIPKIGALLAYLNSALNPYLYSFLGTNFSKRWKLLKQSRGIQQFVSLAVWRQNDSNSGNKKDCDRSSKHGMGSRYNIAQSSDNKISTQRPTVSTRIPIAHDLSRGSPSFQSGEILNDKSPYYSTKSSNNSSREVLPSNGKY